MKNFKELMMEKAKKGEFLNDDETNAMSDALGSYSNDEDEMMDKLKGKSVTVSSDNKEGLEEGLEMASEIVDNAPEMDDEEDMDLPEVGSESSESLESLMSQVEELKAKIEALAPEMDDSEILEEEEY